MPDNQLDTPSDRQSQLPDSYEHVRCDLYCYGANYNYDQTDIRLPVLQSVVLGPRGVRLPLDASFLKELPASLISIYQLDGTTLVHVPIYGTKYQIEMERHLAVRKGFKING